METAPNSQQRSTTDDYFYTLPLAPTDIIAIYRNHQLIIEDADEKLPTQSPALQLVCMAYDHQISLKRMYNHWRNRFIIQGTCNIQLFIQTLKIYYPFLAHYLTQLCVDRLFREQGKYTIED